MYDTSTPKPPDSCSPRHLQPCASHYSSSSSSTTPRSSLPRSLPIAQPPPPPGCVRCDPAAAAAAMLAIAGGDWRRSMSLRCDGCNSSSAADCKLADCLFSRRCCLFAPLQACLPKLLPFPSLPNAPGGLLHPPGLTTCPWWAPPPPKTKPPTLLSPQ
jgi:hypothetical protein